MYFMILTDLKFVTIFPFRNGVTDRSDYLFVVLGANSYFTFQGNSPKRQRSDLYGLRVKQWRLLYLLTYSNVSSIRGIPYPFA